MNTKLQDKLGDRKTPIVEVNLLNRGFVKKSKMYHFNGWWVSLRSRIEWVLSKAPDFEVVVKHMEDIDDHIENKVNTPLHL